MRPIPRTFLLAAALLFAPFAHAVDGSARARELADRLLQEHRASRGLASVPAPEQAESFEKAHARRQLSLEGLKNHAPSPMPPLSAEQILSAFGAPSRTPASVPVTNPWDGRPKEVAGNDWTLVFMAVLGVLAGLAVAYALFLRPQRAVMQLVVPGSGEHFAIRPGNRPGEFVLDIMDVRGTLVRSAGMLRPQSVARAAVLPPELAARLGAKGAFDRFEFTPEGGFVKTHKEEGYQVFPFVLE